MDNKKEKVDRRVRYTKMVLRESLLDLMKQKPIGKITPTELCRHADINRNTFYTHYNSTESLLHSIEDELYEQVKSSVERSLRQEEISSLLTDICQVIYDNGDLCKILFSDYGDKDFLMRITHLAHDRAIAEWISAGMEDNEELTEMLFTYFTSGSVSIIQKWIQGDIKKSPQEIALFIEITCCLGLQAFFN